MIIRHHLSSYLQETITKFFLRFFFKLKTLVPMWLTPTINNYYYNRDCTFALKYYQS